MVDELLTTFGGRANIKEENEAGSSMIVGFTATLIDADLADRIAYFVGPKK